MMPVLNQEPLWMAMVLLHGVPRQKKARKRERQKSIEGNRLETLGCCRSVMGWIMWGVRDCAAALSHVEEKKILQGSTTARTMTFAVGSLLLGGMENQLRCLWPGSRQGQSLSYSCSSFSSSCPRSCSGGSGI